MQPVAPPENDNIITPSRLQCSDPLSYITAWFGNCTIHQLINSWPVNSQTGQLMDQSTCRNFWLKICS